jgi:hypothetical protein
MGGPPIDTKGLLDEQDGPFEEQGGPFEDQSGPLWPHHVSLHDHERPLADEKGEVTGTKDPPRTRTETRIEAVDTLGDHQGAIRDGYQDRSSFDIVLKLRVMIEHLVPGTYSAGTGLYPARPADRPNPRSSSAEPG